ncbi:MAG: cation:proton antiporter [Myxococcota bacterium]
MAGGSGHQVDYVRKGIIVLLLLGFVVFSHQYVIYEGDHDPRGLFALGFVILASYIIGELVELIKLPHITGYLLGGLFLGPSLGETLHKVYPDLHLIPPFDHGILNADIIQQLGLLDTLALPLICLTAGGALQPKEIWKSKFPISGLLIGQVVAMFVGIIGLFYLMSGPISALTLPQLAELSLPAVLAMGAVAASISIATSDAATIAIVVSAKARGPMTTNIVSVAVLKDVVVVIAFSASTAIATATLGVSSGGTLTDSLIAIAISCLGGVVLGFGIHLYLKLVGQELVLFLVGLIFTVSFLSDALHLESALMFIVAGFVIANWSEHGDRLIKEVERLSTPVFVVFFTLAGAKLHLDVLASIAVLAIALAGVRAAAFFIGCRLGGALSGADQASQKYAWMGFVSQAGLAITLANTFPATYGSELGGALFSFILGGVAIHELVGPAMLQAALGLAKELPTADTDAPPETVSPQNDKTSDVDWGPDNPTQSDLLNAEAQRLSVALTDWAEQILESLQPRINTLTTLTRPPDAQGCLNLGQGTLLTAWDTKASLHALDSIIDSLSDGIVADREASSYLKKPEDGSLKGLFKSIARQRYKILKAQRLVDVRGLGRYYFSGQGPSTLIQFAEELLAVERNVAHKMKQWQDGALESDAVQDYLASIETLIRQRLFKSLQYLFHRFSSDLTDYATVACPAVTRRFRLVFDARNDGILSLVEEKNQWTGLAHARWNTTALQLIHKQTHQKTLTHIRTQSAELKAIVASINTELQDFQTLMIDTTGEEWRSWCQKQLSDAQKIIAQLERFDPVDQWLHIKAGHIDTHRQMPDSLHIATDMDSILWNSIQDIKTWDVYPNAVLEESLQRCNENIRSLSGPSTQMIQNLVAFFKEVQTILDFYKLHDSPELSAISRLGHRLKELSPLFQTQLTTLLDSLDTEIPKRLGQLEELWYKPVSTPQAPVAFSVNARLNAVSKQVQRLKHLFVPPAQDTITAPDAYRRLFINFYGENVLNPERTALFSDLQSCIHKRHSLVVQGPSFELTPYLRHLFKNSTQHTFFKTPTSPVSIDQLLEWLEAAQDGVLIIANAQWIFDSNHHAHHAVDRIQRHIEDHKCILVLGMPEPVWAQLTRTTQLEYSIRHAFDFPKLREHDLEKLLLTRHMISGYGLHYSRRTNLLVQLLEELKLKQNHSRRWMRRLMHLSQGNRLEASRCWLQSIHHIDEDNAMLSLCSHPNQPPVQFSDDDLILFRQLIRFGWVNAQSLQAAFDCSEHAAHNWLMDLVNQEVLLKSGDAYSLCEWLEFPIAQALKQRGWLS